MKSTVAIEQCNPASTKNEVIEKVADVIQSLPGIEERIAKAKRIFIKINLAPIEVVNYKNRTFQYVDPEVFEGCAAFFRKHSDAEIIVGDGADGMGPKAAAENQGHMRVINKYNLRFVDLNEGPYERFEVPKPAMFRWYELASELKKVDLFVSLAKMKSHHLCGVTLSIKNLFGLPPNKIYGCPRISLHSAIRLPPILADLTQLFTPEICVIDGILSANYMEWSGDPVSTGVLIAGNNPVATDSVAARFMGVDPEAQRGTAPFIRADNHLRMCADLGLGPVRWNEISLIGTLTENRKPFTVFGASEPSVFEEMENKRKKVARLACWYFDNRKELARKYANQIMYVMENEMISHKGINVENHPDMLKFLRDKNLEMYDIFSKLVFPEEDELREPYDSALSN